jgi:endonuclease-3
MIGTSYVKKTTEILATKYNGVPPNTLAETLEFPGVGPKMAHLYLQIAHGMYV